MITISDLLLAYAPTISVRPTDGGGDVLLQFADRGAAQAFFEALEAVPCERHDELSDLPGFDHQGPENGCTCAACWPRYPYFRVCSICGNKRCPHAADHALTCTHSNEPAQIGSLYE